MSKIRCNLCAYLFDNQQVYEDHLPVCNRIHNLGVNMPNRLQNENRKWVVRFLSARDGYQCFHCGFKPSCNSPPLQVDHADGIENNWNPENLHLLCQKCNLDFRSLTPQEHIQILSQDSAKNVCVNKKGSIAGELYQNRLYTDNVSIEIAINSYIQTTWEQWFAEKVGNEGIVTQFDAVYGGAKAARCSPASTTRFLNMAISCEGEYILHKAKEGNFITRKANDDNS